ncbi:TPA: hypothetical protein ACU9LL_004793 [Citrobacter freundii]|uniref:hypothetical protein n=1 Tax=Citrobacter freundii TaxID=546 RepID=UPI000AB277ED|nr:hypothetical protein [Citrobacter freundii]MDH0219850.1 hypothetical protein [Citrobacter freundii]MDH0243348.1 hypothetical protein [Citrobacter freundii]MDH0987181.1 hypothetical protein [Citrobacter freundii]MDH1351997.1 hypothetical protein [Citrobacter freundii]MDH1383347.1 hypothetical protein [Citrobacter freundii]
MKPDVKKIIADIKATKGNRKFCNGLAGTLQDDNYASSICKYVKTVTPERIDLLIEYTENLEAEVTDMAVQLANAESKCRELAGENEKQNTHSEALAVDNAALREVVERMVNQFAMSGISPEEKSINPAKSLMFDAKSALFMPATDAFLAEVLASELDSLAGVAETMLVKFSNQRCSQDMHEVVGWKMVLQQASNRAAKLRKGAVL